MSFTFKQKTESLNWDMLAEADLDHIIQSTDIAQLEHLL